MTQTATQTGLGLEVRGLCRQFGALNVTNHVDLTLRPGARAALIGPNGAGKTTLINLITGALVPSAGTVHLDGRDITGLGTAARARLGLFRTFQITRLFKSMTVGDNVRQAVLQSTGRHPGMWQAVSRDVALDAQVERALGAVKLRDRAQTTVHSLAYGEQRLVELALAIAARPRVLLLDEPAAGVPQSEANVIVDALENLPTDLAILLIEHDMDLVFRLASEITVLVAGSVLMTGTPVQVADDPRVRSLYLGEGGHERH